MRLTRFVTALVVAISSMFVGAATATAATSSTYTCSGGSAQQPSLINPGNYSSIRVTGACLIPGGTVNVRHDVTIGPGAVLVTNLPASPPPGPPEDDAILNVGGNVSVGEGATLMMGCAPSFGCRVTTPDKIGGNVIADDPLGLLMHAVTVEGNYTQSGGGGRDFACKGIGIFTAFHSPVYSAFEDGTIAGNATLEGYRSCWMGMARTYVGGSLTVNNIGLGDPDGVEILSNHILGNLSCHGNMFVDVTKTPPVFTAHQPWDSTETSFGSLYPRTWEPNTVVDGQRYGQCVAAPALTQGGTSPGPF